MPAAGDTKAGCLSFGRIIFFVGSLTLILEGAIDFLGFTDSAVMRFGGGGVGGGAGLGPNLIPNFVATPIIPAVTLSSKD